MDALPNVKIRAKHDDDVMPVIHGTDTAPPAAAVTVPTITGATVKRPAGNVIVVPAGPVIACEPTAIAYGACLRNHAEPDHT